MKSNRYLFLPFAILLSVICSQSTPAFSQGNVHALDSATWYVATTGNDGNDCLGTSTPCATIQGAINKSTDGDTIQVAGGTYTSSGTEVVLINKSITLSGGWNIDFTSQSDTSIIDGQATRQGINVNSRITIAINHFTIQNGYTSWGQGGGINNVLGAITLSDSTIKDNKSRGAGGGISNYNGTMVINNTNITGNIMGDLCCSGGGGGGGIANNGGGL